MRSFSSGATGRDLTLPCECLGQGFTFRVGSKRIFPLFPRSLKERMVKERQEKVWDPQHKLRVAEAARRMQVRRKYMQCYPHTQQIDSQGCGLYNLIRSYYF